MIFQNLAKTQKELLLGFKLLLFGILCWWFLKYIFYFNGLTTSCWILGAILFIIWGSLLCFAMLLIEDRRILFGSFGLTLISYLFFFNNEPFYYVIALFIFALCFWSGINKTKQEKEILTELKFERIWKKGLPIVVTGLILVVSFTYYFSPQLQEMEGIQLSISRSAFNALLGPLESLIEERLPGNADLDSRALSILTPEEKQDIESNYGIQINENDTIRDVLFNLLNYQLSNTAGPYRKFIPFGLAVGLFIILKILSIFYVLIVIGFSWIVMKILIAMKFASITTEQQEKEIIII